MQTKASALLATAFAFGLAPPVHAHHSIGMIETSRPIWVRGQVVDFRVAHPHVTFTMDGIGPDGRTQRWIIEGPNLMRLARMHADANFLRPGDPVQVCGFALKPSVMSTQKNLVHGHLLVMPDGHRRLFGPYGKLDNCVLPGDAARTWIDFLSADPLGLEAWCSGLRYSSVPSVARAELVGEITRGLNPPCH